MVCMKTYSLHIHVNVNGVERLHKTPPVTVNDDDYYDKLEHYQGYGDWQFFDATCVNEYGELYILVLNANLLKTTYFIFKEVSEELY